ncbi:MAG: hypothetical protein AB7S70_15615 [Hyphomicrobium sp.]|uniref:hypothetical protein n=1 Tax=Hyphomicrobium sp. TaxID=82 RepID=UPI003D140A93
MSPRVAGLLWCATFVALDALQAVAYGNFLQRLDGFLVGLLVFGFCSLACLTWVAWKAPHEIAIARSEPAAVLWMGVTSAGGWLTYLGALQLIEPAVALTVVSGALPLTMIVAGHLGIGGAEPVHNRVEVAGNLVLALGIVALAAFTLLGWSGFVRGGALVGLFGLVLSILSGAMFAGMILISYRLERRGVGPAASFVLRFPLYLVLAFAGTLMGLDDKGPAPADDLMLALVVGVPLLALPIYAIQKAVALASSLTIGTAAGLTPVLVFLLQMIEGRVDYSRATVIGLLIYMAGALLAAAGRARAIGDAARPH